jgi:hypothetical protein
MQGPSEMGASGKLLNWDRSGDLGQITVPTLVIGATHDTMDPKHMEWMAGAVAKGRFLLCPDGSHLAIYDDQQVYFDGLIRFIKDVEASRFGGWPAGRLNRPAPLAKQPARRWRACWRRFAPAGCARRTCRWVRGPSCARPRLPGC